MDSFNQIFSIFSHREYIDHIKFQITLCVFVPLCLCVKKMKPQVYAEIERIMSETRTLTFAEFDSVPSTILRTQDSRIA